MSIIFIVPQRDRYQDNPAQLPKKKVSILADNEQVYIWGVS